MTYPRDYRQERSYGCSAIGVIVTIGLVGLIMFVVVFLTGNSYFYIFPFVDPSNFDVNPEMSAVMPYLTLIIVVSLAGVFGSWFYYRLRQSTLELEDTTSRAD